MSSYKEPKFETKKANADLSAKQYCFVKDTAASDGTKVQACVAGEKAIGVVMNIAGANQDAEIAGRFGGALLKIAATVAAGDSLKPDANGAGIIAVTTNVASAIACEDGVAGDVISVDILQHYVP